MSPSVARLWRGRRRRRVQQAGRLATLCLVAAVAVPAVGQQRRAETPAARTWSAEVTIPTYELGPDDVNPHFQELEGTIIYPYTMQDRFGSERVERVYRAVFVENEYLRVMCLPEIGGRIQSVLDKVTGEEMFYRNRVIRPGHIALRGAWISGGIEWNRGPQGHTVTSFSPVDVLPVDNDDGSASLVIGSIEHNFRTGWEVRLTLRPGVRALDEQIRLFNPTDGFHPYYFWNNTAFPNRPGTRFVFPMTLGTDHAGTTFFSWPIHEGRDLRRLLEYPEPTSVFGYRVAHDFFGAYDVDRDYGIVQVANHHELPGKKAWTWGESDAGLVAQSVLTDDDGPYIEVQSGPLPTQNDYGMLAPGQEISWQETWYPVHGLGGGYEYATRDVAIQRIDQAQGLELRIAATRAFPGARLLLDVEGSGDGTGEPRSLNLTPERVVSVRRPMSAAAGAPPAGRVAVRLEDAAGRLLAEFTSPLDVPERQPPAAPASSSPTAERHYLDGVELDKAGDEPAARRRFARALEIDPAHAPTLAALGGLELEAGRDEAAAELLERALEGRPSDGLSWFQLGVARLRLGRIEAALAAGYAAVQRPGTSAAGYSLVGRALARAGDMAGAARAFTAGLSEGGGYWTRLFEQLLIATWAAGARESAAALAGESIDAGTLRLVPRAVRALHSDEALRDSVRDARRWVGEPEFAFIELSLAFADLGRHATAARILEASVASAGSPGALTLYYLAWHAGRAGHDNQASRWLSLASAAPTDYVFPSRPESLAVFRYALERQPDDVRARLYLGNALAGLGRLREAADQWSLAIDANPESSTARRSLAFYRWRLEDDTAAAAALLAEAIAMRPGDQTLHRDLGRLHLEQGRAAAAVDVLETVVAGERRADVTLMLARAYVESGRLDDAIDLLAASRFTQREGDTGSRAIFYRAHIERGVRSLEAGDAAAALEDFDAAITYPSHLNVGRPHRPLEARALYWRGRALEALGRIGAATDAWRSCAQGARTTPEQIDFIARCERLLASSRDDG